MPVHLTVPEELQFKQNHLFTDLEKFVFSTINAKTTVSVGIESPLLVAGTPLPAGLKKLHAIAEGHGRKAISVDSTGWYTVLEESNSPLLTIYESENGGKVYELNKLCKFSLQAMSHMLQSMHNVVSKKKSCIQYRFSTLTIALYREIVEKGLNFNLYVEKLDELGLELCRIGSLLHSLQQELANNPLRSQSLLAHRRSSASIGSKSVKLDELQARFEASSSKLSKVGRYQFEMEKINREAVLTNRRRKMNLNVSKNLALKRVKEEAALEINQFEAVLSACNPEALSETSETI